MKKLTLTPELRTAAQNCMPGMCAEDAIADPIMFAAHVLTANRGEDWASLMDQITLDDIREVLDNAPPNVFDNFSWAYWNVKVGRYETPAAKVRVISRTELRESDLTDFERVYLNKGRGTL